MPNWNEYLIIANIPVGVQTNDATERVVYVGTTEPNFNGGLMSDERGERSVWEFLLEPLTTAKLEELRAAIRGAAHVTCSGVLLRGVGVNVTCRVTLRDVPYVEDTRNPDGFLRMAGVLLEEEQPR